MQDAYGTALAAPSRCPSPNAPTAIPPSVGNAPKRLYSMTTRSVGKLGNIGARDSCSERAMTRAASGHSAGSSRRAVSSIPGSLRGGQPRGTRGLIRVDLVGVPQRKPDVVEPFHQAPPRELLHVEDLVQP